ncbi:ADP-ribosyltransferase [Aquimarina macrocephali]|uniref:ADP-ribosyltransferase n=1 Tax=Aquimarina macrocephali TaxID=666563 RepID=UPI000463548A|nr:ADP-ribosyltransferase [Aquimarina macrocephali]
MKANISKVILTILFLFIGLVSVKAECSNECLANIFKTEFAEKISGNGSENLIKYFEDNTTNAYKAWRVLYKADKNVDRFDLTNLTELADYITSSKKAPHVIVKEIEDAGGYIAFKKTMFLPNLDLENLDGRVLKKFEQYFDDILTKDELIAGVKNELNTFGIPETIILEIDKIDDFSIYRDILRSGGKDLYVLSKSDNPELVEYARTLIEARRNHLIHDHKHFKHAIKNAENVFKLPIVKGKDVTNGSGGLGTHFLGEFKFDGKLIPARFKFDRNVDYDAIGEIETVTKGLEPYGGAKFYSRIRVQEPNGVWQDAVAMEAIDGYDLFALYSKQKNKEILPIKITSAHLKAFDDILEQLARDGKILGDTNLGDFMLTKDPKRPIVFLDMPLTNGGNGIQNPIAPGGIPIRETIKELLDEVKSEFLEVLSKNEKFKIHYDGLLNNPSKRKFKDVLSIEEEAVLIFYTTNPGYKNLNKALRSEIEMTEEFIAQEKLMNQALAKLPNSSYNQADDLLYRIENLTNDEINTIYKKGDIITKKGFYSTTYSRDAIKSAMDNRVHTVLIRIKGKNGKLIEDLSTFAIEKEVLFKSNTRFKVNKIYTEEHILLETGLYSSIDDIIKFDGAYKEFDMIRVIELIEL